MQYDIFKIIVAVQGLVNRTDPELYLMRQDAGAYGYCGLANASVYTHYPLREKYVNRKPKDDAAEFGSQKTYILFYAANFESAAPYTFFRPAKYAKENGLTY